MIDKAAIEQQLAELPLFQYDWITTSELVFSERVRYICQTQCPMYNTTWACPRRSARSRNARRAAFPTRTRS